MNMRRIAFALVGIVAALGLATACKTGNTDDACRRPLDDRAPRHCVEAHEHVPGDPAEEFAAAVTGKTA